MRKSPANSVSRHSEQRDVAPERDAYDFVDKAAAARRLKAKKRAANKLAASERMKKLQASPTPGMKRAAFKGKGDPRNGRGPKKGTGGRPPDAWKELMGRLANRTSTIRAAKRVLRDPSHSAWFGAFKFIAEQKYGKARESLDVHGKLTLEDLLDRSREDSD